MLNWPRPRKGGAPLSFSVESDATSGPKWVFKSNESDTISSSIPCLNDTMEERLRVCKLGAPLGFNSVPGCLRS